jgi:hypothetical protein
MTEQDESSAVDASEHVVSDEMLARALGPTEVSRT